MTNSKRQEIKERNLRRKRRQQITMLLIFGGIALVLAAIIAGNLAIHACAAHTR